VLTSAAASLALIGAAITLYPGGNTWNPTAHGYDHWRNALCDLLADVAPNGAPNPGAQLAALGMLAFTAGLFPFWLLLPRLFPSRPRLGAAVRALGLIATTALALVPLLPSQRYGRLHALAIFMAWLPGLAAGALATIALLTTPKARSPHGYLAAATLTLTLICGLLYAAYLITNDTQPLRPMIPLQKLGILLLLAWIITASLSAARARLSPQGHVL